MLNHLLLANTIESPLHLLPLLVFPLFGGHALIQILGQDPFFLQVSDLARTIVREGSLVVLPLLPSGGGPPSLRFSELGLLLSNKSHELLNVLDRVDGHLVIGLALRAVHELVFLAHEVLDDSLDLW